MLKKHITAVLGAAIFLVSSGPSFSGTVIDRIVAIVGDDVITLSELQSEMAMPASEIEKRLTGDDLAREMSHLKRNTLNQLIDRKVQVAEAKRQGIVIPKEDIDLALEDIMKSNNMTDEEFRQALAGEGYNYEEYRENLEAQLMVLRLINREVRSKVIVEEPDARAYYEENSDKFTTPGSVTIANIFFPAGEEGMEAAEKNALEARSKIEGGMPFEEMAVQCTGDPEAGEKCVLGSFKKGELSRSIEEIAYSMTEGDVSEPIKTDTGYQLIKIMQKTETVTRPYEEVESEVYNDISSRKAEGIFADWLDGLRARTFIEVRE